MNIATLGLVKKTGRLVCGFDAVKLEIESKSSKICGILIANDLSEKSKKELFFFRDKHKPSLEIVEIDAAMEQTKKILGKPVGIMAVCDDGFWKAVTNGK